MEEQHTDELQLALDRLKKAEDGRALDADAAMDWIELPGGLRLLKPTVAHAWAMAKAAQSGVLDTYGINLISAYILAHGQAEVRSRIMPLLIPSKIEALIKEAEMFLLEKEAFPGDVLDALRKLSTEAFGAKKNAATTP